MKHLYAITIKKTSLTLQNLSIFANFLLLFFVIIDPTNVLFHMKDIAFIFFVAVSIPFINYRKIYVPLTFVTIYFFSFSLALLMSSDLELSKGLGYLKTFIFLAYVLWMDKGSYLKAFKVFYFWTLVMSAIVIVFFVIFSSLPDVASQAYSFFMEKDAVIMICKRTFLGIQFQQVFYRTSPCASISLAGALICFFSARKFKYLIHSLLFFLCLFIATTRANMVSALFITAGITLFYLFYRKKALTTFVTIGLCTATAALILVVALLSEDDPGSIGVKAGHVIGYWKLFEEEPLRYVFIGAGPGKLFYSYGFKSMTPYTELSYYDLIKDFGLLGTVIILFLILCPLFQIYKNKTMDKFVKISLTIGYFAYLFIAGTNPLLISSTGFIVIAIMYYISNKNFNIEFNLER